jgi:stearoyl-CoA desaturase (Delta-9 desaturase)
MGWIFVKEEYPLLKLVDKGDLDNDIVVRFQHKYFIPLAVAEGLVVPTILGVAWFGNWLQGFLWGGVIARLCIWHSTYDVHRLKNIDDRFLINSLAHYIGDQKYTKEVSARGNFLLALLTNGN